MSIGVQNTNPALLALQTLGRLNDAASTSNASTAPDASSASTPSVVADSSVQGLSADGLGAMSASLDQASSVADAALAAGQSVTDLLGQMKALAGQAQDGSTSDGSVSDDFSALLAQINAAVSGAGFDGVNLLDGSSAPSVAFASGSGGQVTLTAVNLSLGGGVISLGAAATLATPTAAANVLSNIDTSLANLGQALDQIGDQSSQIAAHAGFVSRLSAVLSASDAAASAPSSADDAKLMALQIQQQLAGQGGAIANAAPNVVLSLFK